MFGVAARLDVKVGVIAGGRVADDRRVFRLLREFLEGVESLLIDQITLFDPAFDSGCCADLGEALFAVKYFYALAVLGGSDTIEYLRKLVAQRDLRGRDVVDFEHTFSAAAAGDRYRQRDSQQN